MKRLVALSILILLFLSSCSENLALDRNTVMSYYGHDTYISFDGDDDLKYVDKQGFDTFGMSNALEAIREKSSSENRPIYKIGELSSMETYVYQIGSDEPCEIKSKRTSSFSCGFLGDTQANPDTGKIVLDSLLKQLTDESFLLIAGDLVNTASNTDELSNFFASSNDIFKYLPVDVAAGNHTPKVGFVPEGEIPGFYSFDYGNATFVILNSNTMGTLDDEKVMKIQEFIQNELSRSGKRWKIAMLHHPLFTINSDPKDITRAKIMKKNYMELLRGFDLLLCGHQHSFSRVESEGFIQLMGNARDKKYEAEDFDYIKSTIPGPVYTHLSFDEGRINVKTFDIDSALIDEFDIKDKDN